MTTTQSNNKGERIGKIVIWGGCATRDAFPASEILNYKIKYLHRSSMAALLSKGTNDFDQDLTRAHADIKKESELTAARRDCNAKWNLLEELKCANIIIVDLLSERDGVFQKCDRKGREIISNSGAYKEKIKDDILNKDFSKHFGYSEADGFFELFGEGIRKFAEMVQVSSAKLVLNEIYCATLYDDDTSCDKPGREAWIQDTNKRLKKYYDKFIDLADPDLVVSYHADREIIARRSGHRWGPAPFHFVSDFYEVLPRRIFDEWGFVLNQQIG